MTDSCTETTLNGCDQVGGQWQGDNTTCAADCQPPTGACCTDVVTCVITTEEDCLAQSGSYFGTGTECYDNICSQDLDRGACCIDGQCSDVFPLTCAILGGAWLGTEFTCESGPCRLCPADIDLNGVVDVQDFLDLLAGWGTCPDF